MLSQIQDKKGKNRTHKPKTPTLRNRLRSRKLTETACTKCGKNFLRVNFGCESVRCGECYMEYQKSIQRRSKEDDQLIDEVMGYH